MTTMHAQAANQARIHALDPTARSRLNAIFMATMILGGACGWDLAGLAYSAWAGAAPACSARHPPRPRCWCHGGAEFSGYRRQANRLTWTPESNT
ncbi:hypothetical protein [Mesorhizobium japonicum]